MVEPQIIYEDFDKVDIRVGKVVKVEDFPEARKPLYKITVDFGNGVGIKQSAVGATHLYNATRYKKRRDVIASDYKKEDLEGKLILGLVNMPPKRIGAFESEFLTLGVSDEEGRCILVVPDPDKKGAVIGGKLF